MGQRVFGYVRVSSKDQNVERQIAALKRNGVEERHMFVDKQSGKDFARPAYRRMCRTAKEGDVITITSVDRLGRNYVEVVEQWRHLTQRKGVSIVVLDMPILNTRNSHDLTQRLISDLVLYLLSYVAEMERRFIRQRQKEGIAAARLRGVKFGAPRKMRPAALAALAAKWRRGEISCRNAARILSVSRSTFMRWAAE